jgi:hypothetical protein
LIALSRPAFKQVFSFSTRAVLNSDKEFVSKVLGEEAKQHLMSIQPCVMAHALSDSKKFEDPRWRFLLWVSWMFLGFKEWNLGAVEDALCSIASPPELHSLSFVFSLKWNTTAHYVSSGSSSCLHPTCIESTLPTRSTTWLDFNIVFLQSVPVSTYIRR